jgi:hypothetical protein
MNSSSHAHFALCLVGIFVGSAATAAMNKSISASETQFALPGVVITPMQTPAPLPVPVPPASLPPVKVRHPTPTPPQSGAPPPPNSPPTAPAPNPAPSLLK